MPTFRLRSGPSSRRCGAAHSSLIVSVCPPMAARPQNGPIATVARRSNSSHTAGRHTSSLQAGRWRATWTCAASRPVGVERTREDGETGT